MKFTNTENMKFEIKKEILKLSNYKKFIINKKLNVVY